jgi:hypothetical protein
MYWCLPDENGGEATASSPCEHMLCPECIQGRLKQSVANSVEVVDRDALKKKIQGSRYIPRIEGEQTDLFG